MKEIYKLLLVWILVLVVAILAGYFLFDKQKWVTVAIIAVLAIVGLYLTYRYISKGSVF